MVEIKCDVLGKCKYMPRRGCSEYVIRIGYTYYVIEVRTVAKEPFRLRRLYTIGACIPKYEKISDNELHKLRDAIKVAKEWVRGKEV